MILVWVVSSGPSDTPIIIHTFKPRRWHIIPTTEIIWNGLACWAVRQCCPVWLLCRPTIFQDRRKWCHIWAKDWGPVLSPSIVKTTATMFSLGITTAISAICQQGPVHHCWAEKMEIILRHCWANRKCWQTRICSPKRSTENPHHPPKLKKKYSTMWHHSTMTTYPSKSRRISFVTTVMERSGAVITLRDIYWHIQEKSHLPVMHVIWGLFSVIT